MNATLPLRATYQDSDVTFYLLNDKPSSAEQNITVSIKGETYNLYKNMGRWQSVDQNLPDKNLLSAIGDSISLRYRI